MDIDSFYEAKKHYEGRGYKYVDLPWHTSKVFQEFTLPPGVQPSLLKMQDVELCLVGSAEQSFIEAFDSLSEGRYYALTPCFRNEPKFDDLHHRYFMKLELIHLGSRDYIRLLEDAEVFFWRYLNGVYRKNICDSDGEVGSIDLLANHPGEKGIELGSYGWRENSNYIWSYGTGLAQPRLKYAINQ